MFVIFFHDCVIVNILNTFSAGKPRVYMPLTEWRQPNRSREFNIRVNKCVRINVYLVLLIIIMLLTNYFKVHVD